MLYVFFEHHKDAEGKTLATDVSCSSWLSGKGINWKADEIPFKVLNGLFKTPPIATRSYNDALKIWTYLGDVGFTLLETVEQSFKQFGMNVEFREVEHLEAQLQAGGLKQSSSKKFDPANFFYNRAGVNTTQEISKPMASVKLAEILQVPPEDITRKLYLKACMRLHPDRNGGDGSKMSELNMYWQVYNAS